ncbi:multidrug ABC transporter ATPase [Microbacterium elymi]|uniref:Multidrug ABC transporter ATPase n=1 Tax=Microbacterium elymi TaxID=2909587 RepID=A0ABY5NIK4_9MICO|nr:multidrug ABC transporter ATPase [Microbacterium elymi]UUT35015.1 multidrug ABC transporter ATPase [Microbacterium elymi]
MSAPTPSEEIPVRRIDRMLSFTALGLLVLSVVCFFSIMIGSAMHASFDQGLWPTIGAIVYIAPIVAFLLILTVVIMSFVRRSRANKAR